MKNKTLQTILFSTVGLAAMAIILVGFNAITSAFNGTVRPFAVYVVAYFLISVIGIVFATRARTEQ